MSTDGSEISGGPAVAMAPSGSFVVVWATDGRVLARRYDGTGAAVDGPFEVLSHNDGSERPAVATDEAGNFTVVWEGNYVISPVELGDRAVFAQRYDQAGNALGSPVQVNDEPVAIAWPRVVADMQGSFLITWRQSAPNTALEDIVFRRLDGAGMLGTAVRVNPEGFAAAENAPAIAADRSGGFVIAGWYSLTRGIRLFATRYDGAGGTSGTASLTNDSLYWFGRSAPVLASDPYGGFAIAFALGEYPASEAPPGALSTRAAMMPRERRLERTCE